MVFLETLSDCVNIQSLVIFHTALTDLHQIKQQQKKTDREMAALKNTITGGKNTTGEVDMTRNFAAQLLISPVFILMWFIKAGQPVYKQANWFLNRQPIYKAVKFAISSQISHSWHSWKHLQTVWIYMQSLATPPTALTDLQQQIEQLQNKTDRQMAALENTIMDGKNTTTQMK